MQNFTLAIVFFLAIHLVISGTPLRAVIVKSIGERPYMGLFSLLSVAGLVWIIVAYPAAVAEPGDFTTASRAWTDSAVIVMFFAFLLAVPGLLTPNPTLTMMEGQLEKEDAARGILRITRHPFLWSVVLWAAIHMAMNPNPAHHLLFGSFLVLALLGTIAIDHKRAQAFGDKWERFKSQTSNVPFWAAIRGRTKIKLGEVGLWRWLVALVAFGAMLYAHQWLFGVSPIPAMSFY